MRYGIRTLVVAVALALQAGCETGPGASAGASRPYAANPGTKPLNVRYQVDAARERVWWLTADGVFVNNARASQKTAVPLRGWTWAAAPWSCMPDLALGPRGEAVVTSNVVPVVWKIDPETLAVSEHPLALDADGDKDVGFSGLTYSPEHEAYFAVSGVHGTLWKIDAQLTRAEKIALSIPIHSACRVAMSPRVFSQASGRAAVGICVSGAERNWTVDLVLAHRSGYVRKTACTDLPWQFRQLALNGGD
jgi:hypothetical protein